MKFENPHEAALLMAAYDAHKAVNTECKHRFPSVQILEAGSYTYSDGSGGEDAQYWTVNHAFDPYAMRDRKHNCQTVEAISLMVGLYAEAPRMYAALNALLEAKDSDERLLAEHNACDVMARAVNQDWKS